MIIILSIAAFVATLLGGFFALHFKDKSHLILGFSAGAVIAVAFFDLIPEALQLGGPENISFLTTMIAGGFVIYMLLDRFFLHHCHDHNEHDHAHEDAIARGRLRASSLSIHSFLDGVAIGLAFQVSPAVGTIVAAAVLTHDFSDGINTISLVTKNGGPRSEAVRWLLIDALAPVIGVVFTRFFQLPLGALAIILSIFAGFFLYIGASDLLPESHHSHPTVWTTVSTILGMLVMYAAISLAGL